MMKQVRTRGSMHESSNETNDRRIQFISDRRGRLMCMLTGRDEEESGDTKPRWIYHTHNVDWSLGYVSLSRRSRLFNSSRLQLYKGLSWSTIPI